MARFLLVLLLPAVCMAVEGEKKQYFNISEGLPADSYVGQLGDATDTNYGPPYLMMPNSNDDISPFLTINLETGIIKTATVLDRERTALFDFIVMSESSYYLIQGEVLVEDINDNYPRFNVSRRIELSESANIGSSIHIGSAIDDDTIDNGIVSYNITSGNENGKFRLKGTFKLPFLYMDLVIEKQLDYETEKMYSLVLSVVDKGQKTGSVTIEIPILDANDNQPKFDISRYSAEVREDAPVGKSVLHVSASDLDTSVENAHITYTMDYQKDPGRHFSVEPTTGIIRVSKPLDYEKITNFQLSVIASDNASQPLRDTASVEIIVTDINEQPANVNLLFLVNGTVAGHVPENSSVGTPVARISVSDPDNPTNYYSNITVTVQGADPYFGLETNDNVTFILYVKANLDREVHPNFNLTILAVDGGSPPLQATKSFTLWIDDVNDHTPQFTQSVYEATVQEQAQGGSSVIQLQATDQDIGLNSQITYGIKSHLNNSNWFEIDHVLGIVKVRARDTIDCEENPNPWIIVTATDSGAPPLTGSATVKINVLDVNDMQPVFAHTYYQRIVSENIQIGSCILTVSADDPDCNGNTQLMYQLSNSSVQTRDRFSLGVSSGKLCVEKPLDYESQHSYTFPVFAVDNGGLKGDSMILITVTDINDNRPAFYPRNYSQNLDYHEANSPGKEIVTVVARDLDSGINGRVFYRTRSGSRDGAFTINSQSGLISLSASLPNEEHVYVVEVEAYDGGGLTSVHPATVYISVMGTNFPRPSFDRATYSFSVPEMTGQHSVVGQVLATITGDNTQAIHYSISSGDADSHFYIDRLSGKIFTNDGNLDHEQNTAYLLSVTAETENPPVFGKAQVNIFVTDINDNAPQFTTRDNEIHVWEDEDMAEIIYKVIATDDDSGVNGTVRYSLVENRESTFQIDEVGGDIRLQKSLDFEDIKTYTLIVNARDLGTPSSLNTNMTLMVYVTNKNDNPPSFQQTLYEVSIAEDLALSSTFLQVQASDRDMDQITYSLQDASDAFGIWPNNGHMYLKLQLDREVENLYQLYIIAKDNGRPSQLSSTATVRILVTDANDNSPEFSDTVYIFPVSEDVSSRSSVGSVTATDQDIGDNARLEYSFVVTQDDFIINKYTGEISTSVDLDRETIGVYEMEVIVRDFGTRSHTDTTMVKIVLLDINDNVPEFVSGNTGTMEENKAKGTEVLKVIAMDPDDDENGTVSYFFDQNASGMLSVTNFELDPKSGWIRTAEVLDYEKSTEYRLVVVARDYGTPPKSSSTTITIKVIDDINEGEIIENIIMRIDVVENIPVGTIIGKIILNPSDTSSVSYFIFAGNDFDLFAVNKSNGDLYCIHEVDYEVSSWHTIGIHAIDESLVFPQTSTIKVNINILDVNDNPPLFERDPVILNKPENQPVGQIVYIFSATDRDSGINGSIRYTIERQEPDFDFFELDVNTGELRIKSVVDYEQIKSISLLVRAEDKSPLPADRLHSTIVVKVMVQDQNDNGPEFKTYSPFYLSESVPVGYVITKLFAVDLDDNVNGSGNGVVSFKIVAGNDGSKFALDSLSGVLSVSHSLDRESKDSYTLNVSATDRGMPQHVAYVTVRVVVDDANDNPPLFDKSVYTAEVPENNHVDLYLLGVTATDVDLGLNQQIKFMIPPGTAGGKFVINETTGAITVTAVLDREEQSSYEFTAFVFDNGDSMLYDTAKVIVQVTDRNDHSPVFQQNTIELRIPENINQLAFYTIKAQDRDEGRNGEISYSIRDGNDAGHFSIDSITGQLSCANVDREVLASYNLTIVAQDSGSPTRTTTVDIHIIVLDENDNSPTFILGRYTKRISEDVQVGTMVLLVSATDRDEYGNGNGRITYSLGNDTDGMFKVDSVSGNITTTRHFDREKKAKYIFRLVAEDNALYNRMRTTTIVEVTLDDVNDNAPVFQNIPYITNLSGNEPSETYVLQVLAVDLDENQINYSLSTTSGVHSLRYFTMDQDNGVLTTNTFSTNAYGYHYLHVIAKDLGSPSRTTTTVVQIKVGTNLNEHLQFTNQTYYAHVSENSDPGTMVTRVTAQAIVSSIQRSIQYAFLEGNGENIFSISNSGEITVNDNEKLDYESHKKIQLLVSARSETLSGYTLVDVSVLDVNDNPPVFAQDPYHTSIREDVAIGTTVSQALATDLDSQENGVITYNILQPNDLNVFLIDGQGYITTRLALDFQIVPQYQLEIEAVDHGQARKTGTCIVTINVVDVNNQVPKFPPPYAENITETAAIGAHVMQVTANDQDRFPPLLYDFDVDGNQDGRFAINKFTGEVTLAKPVDHEGRNTYNVALMVTDGIRTVKSVRNLYIMDVNDNVPVFDQPSYQLTVRERTASDTAILALSATDRDSGLNGQVVYSVGITTNDGFTVNLTTGAITTTREVQYDDDHQMVEMTIVAKDRGQPVRSAVTVVHVVIEPVNHNAPQFSSLSSAINVVENSQKGLSVGQLVATDTDLYQTVFYSIGSGNDNNAFYMNQFTGEIFVNGKLDREVKAHYDLDIVAMDNVNPVKSSMILLRVTIEDVNDESPHFGQINYIVPPLIETYPPGNSFLQVQASDGDLGNHATVLYDIVSGNDDGIFTIDSSTGELKIAASKHLDYEHSTSHRLVIQATDCFSCPLEIVRLSGIAVVVVTVTDVNDHDPKFPVPFYYRVFNENQPVNSRVFQANANDGDMGTYGSLTYSISDDSFFRINPTTGWVYSKTVFDAEHLPSSSRNVPGSFSFVITGSDTGGKSDTVGARIVIGDIDEYSPTFSKENYDIVVPGNAAVGTVIGRVSASDSDDGSAGKLYYFLNRNNDYFDVNITSGMISVKLGFNSNPASRQRRDDHNSRTKRAIKDNDRTLVIEVKSAVPNSRSESTVVIIDIDESCEGCQILPEPTTGDSGGFEGTTMILVIVFAVVLVILVIIVVLLFVRYKQRSKKPVAQVYDAADFHAFDFSPTSSQPRLKYNDVPNYTRSNSNNVNSDVSEHSHHSVSSGRGSVEAEDDEEICMINALQSDLNQSSGFRSKNMPDSGIQDDDNTSEPSIQNSKDYLARLGIDSSQVPIKIKNSSFSEGETLPPFGEEGGGLDVVDDPLDIDYNRLGPVETEPTISVISSGYHNHHRDLGFHEPEHYTQPGTMSGVINSEEEYSGSYNWDYLLDWGPQYQPLAHVFSEIARLKDDTIQPKKRPIQTVPQTNNINTSLKPQVKMIPPPMITNAPPQALSQPANRRSSQSSNASSSYKPPRTHANSNSIKNNVSLPSNARSPITHEGGFTTPLTPSFTPSLLPLATGAPVSGTSNHGGHNMSSRHPMGGSVGQHMVIPTLQECEQELRI